MRTSFFGLNVALSGLDTAQRGLDTVNHNINNVNTPGYSRQVNDQSAVPAMALLDGTGMVGTGSQVTAVNRIRDEYMDFKFWSESISAGEWDVKKSQLSDIEATFNEPSDSGFSKVLDDYFNAMQDLSKDPSSSAARKLVIGDGVSLAQYFNNVGDHFEKLQSDLNDTVKIKVDEINSIGTQIQQLNKQIYSYEVDGNTANDLRDARGALVDKLSKLVNIQANEVVTGKLPNGKDDKHFEITISGKAFVDHFNLSKLAVVQRDTKLNNEDVPNLYDVAWADGNTLEVKGGELKGYLDVRDGNEGVTEGTQQSPAYKGIPFYIRKLNDFVRKFALQINEGITETDNANGTKTYSKDNLGHADGFGIASKAGEASPTGIRFFTIDSWSSKTSSITELESGEFINSSVTTDPNTGLPLTGQALTDSIAAKYQTMTAKNFCVGGDLIHLDQGQNFVAVSATGQPEDAGNLTNIINMRHNSHLFAEGTPEDYMKSLVATLGIDSQEAVRISKTQQNIVSQIDNRRTSNSGVSLDEEMSNLVKFQHAYSAAAKMVSTMQQIYETLINKVGL